MVVPMTLIFPYPPASVEEYQNNIWETIIISIDNGYKMF